MVPEAQRAVTRGLESGRAAFVAAALVVEAMLHAVDLDDETQAVAGEVDDIAADRRWPAPMRSLQRQRGSKTAELALRLVISRRSARARGVRGSLPTPPGRAWGRAAGAERRLRRTKRSTSTFTLSTADHPDRATATSRQAHARSRPARARCARRWESEESPIHTKGSAALSVGLAAAGLLEAAPAPARPSPSMPPPPPALVMAPGVAHAVRAHLAHEHAQAPLLALVEGGVERGRGVGEAAQRLGAGALPIGHAAQETRRSSRFSLAALAEGAALLAAQLHEVADRLLDRRPYALLVGVELQARHAAPRCGHR